MRYRDLTIDLRSAKLGGFEARMGGQDAPVPFPMPVERDKLLDLLSVLHERASPEGRATTEAPDLRAVGEALYQSLFRDGLAERFEEHRKKRSTGVRIRLRFDFRDVEAEYLSSVPWELLRDGVFLAADPATLLVRDVVRSMRKRPLVVKAPLRVLLVGAAIPGTEEEQLVVRERKLIARSLKPLVDEGQVDLVELESLSLDNLRDALLSRNEPVHILHFIGHGGYDPASGFGAVFFVGPDGREHQVSGETFAAHLKGIPWLRLVVLNSCETARYKGRAAAFHLGVAAALLERTEVQAVVAHQHAISFEGAVRFSDTFYRRIAAGDEVEVAVTDMRLRLRHESDEWATPVLFLSSRNGKIFDFDPAKPPTIDVLRPDGEPVRLGVRSIDGWGKDMEDWNDKLLDLTEYFDGRYIKEQPWWQEKVFPRLQRFLVTNAVESRQLVLDFAAHSSIAFAAGWVLESKSGLDVWVRQRTQTELVLDWHPKDHQKHPVPEGPLWLDEPDDELSRKGPDIAVALAVSQPRVAEHVKNYVRRKKLPVGRILRATIAPEPAQRSVAGGAHSLLLAQALVSRIRLRRPHERNGTCHLFCAAPNALVFYLGQLSRSFGRIVLYEHPFGAAEAFGKYQPSIELVAPGPSGDEW
ncbi:MAG TPA: SAVED domain-containing protein [Thermoanaerobaculia bacterium]|nr:SAVED domain-containing protein [Thermoanaerobaculia bacterium]